MKGFRALTSSARRRMPRWVGDAVRRSVLRWGMATASWRQLPDIVVVGAQRSGTTTLFRMLAEHPQLARPTLDKGTGYFDDAYHRGGRWYAAHFPMRLLLRLRRRGAPMRTFECSGYYLFHPLAPERMARDLPGAHVVVLVRDPAERAHSAHRHESARGFEHLDFAAALAAESERLAGEAERLRHDPLAHSASHRHHAYVGRSSYREQIERFVAAFGADRVHVMEAERLFEAPVAEFDRLQGLLGLQRHATTVLTAWNARPGAALDEELEHMLRERFANEEQYMTELLGHPPAWRKD